MNPNVGWILVVVMIIVCVLYSQYLSGLRKGDIPPPPDGRVSRLLNELDFDNYPPSARPWVVVYWILYGLFIVSLFLFAFWR
ncbi:hypothetical protein [Longimicrobium sp.]|uniref:hypothetical protein n=1 Tax=Longimicrobium sp. TaxID=2029185 RepID=UPI002E347FEB|nr:hypothetical protein [Longimicrobium sp.]HEX6036861.1 hypothetical protein [Longimicrobium sp.]